LTFTCINMDNEFISDDLKKNNSLIKRVYGTFEIQDIL